MAKTLKTNPTLATFFRPLSDSEYKNLERNCIENGILDPVVVWQEEQVIVDGHNRYRIAQDNSLEFEITEISFGDIEDAKEWMAERQTGRRNLQSIECASLCSQYLQKHPEASAAEIGEAIGTTSRQVRRVIAANRKIADYFPDDIRERILNGSLVAPIRTCERIDDLEPEEREEVWRKLRANKSMTLQKATPVKKKKLVLNEEHLETVGDFSPNVQQRIATGKLEAKPADLRKVKSLPQAKRIAVNDILSDNPKMTSVVEALDVIATVGDNQRKKRADPVDKAKLRKSIDDAFGKAMKVADSVFEVAKQAGSEAHDQVIDQLKDIRTSLLDSVG